MMKKRSQLIMHEFCYYNYHKVLTNYSKTQAGLDVKSFVFPAAAAEVNPMIFMFCLLSPIWLRLDTFPLDNKPAVGEPALLCLPGNSEFSFAGDTDLFSCAGLWDRFFSLSLPDGWISSVIDKLCMVLGTALRSESAALFFAGCEEESDVSERMDWLILRTLSLSTSSKTGVTENV